MKLFIYRFILAVFSASFMVFMVSHDSSGQSTKLQPSIKLYVMDGGILENMDTRRFGLQKEEVAVSRMSVPCFLIVHPKGILLWDTGAVPDTSWQYTGNPIIYKLILPDLQRDIMLTKPLKLQLKEVGYSPDDVTYLLLSHYHYDHTANANEFKKATWLVRQKEMDTMFAEKPPGVTRPSSYSSLKNNKTKILQTDTYDAFGDGAVIIISAPGHTPGHLVLYVNLPKTGGILLSGDLYHYPEERSLNKVPTFEFNQEQTRVTRIAIDSFLKKTNAHLWIQHDFTANSKLRKSPEYYE